MARILIVDDDEATSRLLELVLADIGDQEITHAGRGTDALAMLEAPAPDILILDMHLPDMGCCGKPGAEATTGPCWYSPGAIGRTRSCSRWRQNRGLPRSFRSRSTSTM